jgi:hypothetical protein
MTMTRKQKRRRKLRSKGIATIPSRGKKGQRSFAPTPKSNGRFHEDFYPRPRFL